MLYSPDGNLTLHAKAPQLRPPPKVVQFVYDSASALRRFACHFFQPKKPALLSKNTKTITNVMNLFFVRLPLFIRFDVLFFTINL